MAGGSLTLGRDIAIDLGTANTLIYVRGAGVVLDEPSTAAVDAKSGQLVAVGWEAKRMWGRAPKNIRLVRPLKDGVIADFDVCEKMLRQFIQNDTGTPHVNERVGSSEVDGDVSPERQ